MGCASGSAGGRSGRAGMDRDPSAPAAVVPRGAGGPASRRAGLGAGGIPQTRCLPVRQGPGGRVTGPDDVLFGRAEIERAFTALGDRLVRRGVVADVFIVGGAAMALAYDATRVTRDVDSLFVPHGVVLEEARNVAQELGLPPWWLNEQASVYISGKDDPGKRRVFDHPGLRVTAASPRHIFAMKALAARTRDIDDLRLLADIIGVESAATALQICADFFPDEAVPPRSAAVLRELFD